jgi:hypothetical protein
VRNLLSWILVLYALRVMKKATKSSKRNQGSPTKKAKSKRITRSTSAKLGKKRDLVETKEQRQQRLAKREALTILAFQMAYDNYHQK